MSELAMTKVGGKKEGRYGWKKYSVSLQHTSMIISILNSINPDTVYYSSDVAIDQNTGKLFLVPPISEKTFNINGDTGSGSYLLDGKYFVTFGSATSGLNSVFRGSGSIYYFNNQGEVSYRINGYQVTKVESLDGCVISDESDAYPANGYQDEYKYVAVVT